jgi:hypothetical protein
VAELAGAGSTAMIDAVLMLCVVGVIAIPAMTMEEIEAVR